MSVLQARSRVRILLCSHDASVNGRRPLDLSPWVVQCSTQKHVKSSGSFSFTLVPAPASRASVNVVHDDDPEPSDHEVQAQLGGWLDVIRPNDVANIYLNDGTSGYVRQLFGYVDSIVRTTEVVPETGAIRTRYVVTGTDLTKAVALTSIYFNPFALENAASRLGAAAAGSDFLGDNLAGAELYRMGLRWFGTPADIVESHLLVLLGYQAQWRLPGSYPDVPPNSNGNIFTGGTDRRADEDHLRLILRSRVTGYEGQSMLQEVVGTGRFADPVGPGALRALIGQADGLQHPLGNGAPLVGTNAATGRTPGTAHFLADRGRAVHLGADIEAARGTPVHPVYAGVIEDLQALLDAGITMRIRHAVGNVVVRSVYAHLEPPRPGEALAVFRGDAAYPQGRAWRPGDPVVPTDILAFTGRSGLVLEGVADHLHLELYYSAPVVVGGVPHLEPVWLDPQTFIPTIRGVPDPKRTISLSGQPSARPDVLAERVLRSAKGYRRGRRSMRTLLDLLDRSYVERDHIDGFIASEQSLYESGDVLTLMQSNANECMNELFLDLRLAGRRERADDAPDGALVPDELHGNVDEDGVVRAPAYRPAVVLREHPFTTISHETYPSAMEAPSLAAAADGAVSGDSTSIEVVAPLTTESVLQQGRSSVPKRRVYGLPEAPGVFFSSRHHPVRVEHCRPITTDTPVSADQPSSSAARLATGQLEAERDGTALAARSLEAEAVTLEEQALRAEEAAANKAAIVANLEADLVAFLASPEVVVWMPDAGAFDPGVDLPEDLRRMYIDKRDSLDRARAEVPDDDAVAHAARARAADARVRADEAARQAADAATQAEAARGAALAEANDATTARRRGARSWRYLDTAMLTLDHILRMEVGRSDYDTFNVLDLQALDSTIQKDIRFINRDVTPVLSYESFSRHGLRLREIYSKATQFGGTPEDPSLRETFARWTILNDHWHQHANQYLAGTIHCLPLLDCRVGYRLDIPELDECYYVEGVRQDWAIEPEGKTTLRTTLTVTRGQPLIRRPHETVRHVSIPGTAAGDTGSIDSNGLDDAVGSERLVPGLGATAVDVAREVAAAKPRPTVLVTRRDVFLRSAIGTRYFPVVDLAAGFRRRAGHVIGGRGSVRKGGR